MDGLCEVLVAFFENDQRRREIGEENHHVLYNYVYIYIYICIYIYNYIYMYVYLPQNHQWIWFMNGILIFRD